MSTQNNVPLRPAPLFSGPVWPVDMADKFDVPYSTSFFSVPRDVFREYNGGVEYSEESMPVTVTIEYRGKGYAVQDTVL